MDKMIIADPLSFGQALRQRRKELGYTQESVSKATGFSVSFISDLENGKPTAELGRALDLASFLSLIMTFSPEETCGADH